MKNLPSNATLLFSESQIEKAIDRLAVLLNMELGSEQPVFVCVLKGAVPLTWDLMRRMDVDVSLACLRVRRFRGTKGGEPHISDFDPEEFRDKLVVIIDTVLDEGVTLEFVQEKLQPLAKKLLTVVLVRKLTNYQGTVDYVGLTAPNKFLIGRGMDMDGMYRGLPAIYTLDS